MRRANESGCQTNEMIRVKSWICADIGVFHLNLTYVEYTRAYRVNLNRAAEITHWTAKVHTRTASG